MKAIRLPPELDGKAISCCGECPFWSNGAFEYTAHCNLLKNRETGECGFTPDMTDECNQSPVTPTDPARPFPNDCPLPEKKEPKPCPNCGGEGFWDILTPPMARFKCSRCGKRIEFLCPRCDDYLWCTINTILRPASDAYKFVECMNCGHEEPVKL